MNIARKIPGKIFSFFLIAVILTVFLPPVLVESAEKESKVLRVAFPETPGFTEMDEKGVRSGIVVDYLNEIAKYTGWTYEYVESTAEEVVDDFLAGKFDLMGGTYYIQGFEKYFGYPEYNCGYSKSVLLARKDDDSVNSVSLESLNGKVIGVYDRAVENVRRLKEFLAMNGLDCTIQEYGLEDLSEDGNLYRFLREGQVDLLLGNGQELSDGFKQVASYDSQPHYIVTQPGDQETLNELNMALKKIMESDPDFWENTYEANFLNVQTDVFQLNKEEIAYVQEKESIVVAVVDKWHPLFCENILEDVHNGVIPDILDKVTEFSGLKFTYLFAESYQDSIKMVQEGKADMLGFFLGSEDDAAQMGLALTKPYAALNGIVVRNKAVSYPGENLIGGVLKGRKGPESIEAAEIREFDTIREALDAVNAGKIDFVYGISSHMEQYIQQGDYTNLVPVALLNDRSEISFALQRPVEPELLTIINKAVNQIPEDEKSTILNKNVVLMGFNRTPLSELIHSNPVFFVCVVAVFVLSLAAAALAVMRSRMRAASIQNELEKAEAESRAKGEFLSRMSHEIRTPMNAVVGLTDITSMMQDVPEPVRKNLEKIKSSSRYLLSLISDILDMSRIDSGKMTVSREPFSMGRMLNELESMMALEAERRGLEFCLKKEMQHDGFTGDELRLRQVLTNLLSNAFKFTPAGGHVLLEVTESENKESGSRFLFRVKDDGIGISEEAQERIFEEFEQSGTSSSKSQGTGLGLPISKNIVSLMGGELRMKSSPGKGSEFYFTVEFPYGEISMAQPEVKSPSDMLKGMKVLLAEDNDLNAEIAQGLLAMQGASVIRAENGRQAVDYFMNSRPGEYQAVLMDIQMPEMNGLEAAKKIRSSSHEDAGKIQIIAMTANSFREDQEAARAAGMNAFVAKPLDVEYLYTVLKRVSDFG